MQTLFGAERLLEGTTGPLPRELIETDSVVAADIREACDKMGLKTSARSTDYIKYAGTTEELTIAYTHVKRNIHTELHGRKFFEPDERYIGYFEQPKLFGDDVFNKFPSAGDDIYEAGMCLALERSTACVMHLMRIVEVGLRTLASTLGVGKQNDWGKYLSEIDKELTNRVKTAGARTADEQFYAEAAAGIDNMRRAWRNPTMHPEKTYPNERAQEILLATKLFMSHLATRLNE